MLNRIRVTQLYIKLAKSILPEKKYVKDNTLAMRIFHKFYKVSGEQPKVLASRVKQCAYTNCTL